MALRVLQWYGMLAFAVHSIYSFFFFFFSLPFCFLCCDLPILLQIQAAPKSAFKSCWSPVVSLCQKARACCSAQFSCTLAIPVFPVVTRASSRSCRCRASKNLSQLGTGCAGHPGGTGKRWFCQTLCASAASKLSREGFWVLLCFLSSRICAHKWSELKKGLPHLWIFKSPVCSFSEDLWILWYCGVFLVRIVKENPHSHQHELLRNLQSEQVALSTPTVWVGAHCCQLSTTVCCVWMVGKQPPAKNRNVSWISCIATGIFVHLWSVS